MSRIVLDASAVLAILNREAGAEKLTPSRLLSDAAISTVNLAEVHDLSARLASILDGLKRRIDPVLRVAYSSVFRSEQTCEPRTHPDEAGMPSQPDPKAGNFTQRAGRRRSRCCSPTSHRTKDGTCSPTHVCQWSGREGGTALQIDQSGIHRVTTRCIHDAATEVDRLVNGIAVRGRFFWLGVLRLGAGGQYEGRNCQPHNESGSKHCSGRVMKTRIHYGLPLHPRKSVT